MLTLTGMHVCSSPIECALRKEHRTHGTDTVIHVNIFYNGTKYLRNPNAGGLQSWKSRDSRATQGYMSSRSWQRLLYSCGILISALRLSLNFTSIKFISRILIAAFPSDIRYPERCRYLPRRDKILHGQEYPSDPAKDSLSDSLKGFLRTLN